MQKSHAAFIGSVPEKYDRYLGPILFEPHALDLARRLPNLERGQVLELACGTGILTRRLRDWLPREVTIVATDLNEAMIDHARRKFAANDPVQWKAADATSLPFPDASFEAVVCQFGFMFVPDKLTAFAESARVLIPGGTLLFNVWDSIEHNELAQIAAATITSYFKDDPPTFYNIPFGFHDQIAVSTLLKDAGFAQPEFALVSLPGISPSAGDAAMGFTEGNPVVIEILERGPSELKAVVNAVAEAIADRYGAGEVRSKTRASVFQAKKPV